MSAGVTYRVNTITFEPPCSKGKCANAVMTTAFSRRRLLSVQTMVRFCCLFHCISILNIVLVYHKCSEKARVFCKFVIATIKISINQQISIQIQPDVNFHQYAILPVPTTLSFVVGHRFWQALLHPLNSFVST